MSREWRPIDGSSSTYSVSTSEAPSEFASPMRCASPPDRVRVRAVERQVLEPDLAEESHPRPRLAQHRVRHLPLERRELDLFQPRVEPAHGELRDLGDRRAADAHLQRVRLELRAAARRALLRQLVLPQEDPDVLLVLLLLLCSRMKGKIPLKPPPLAVQEGVAVRVARARATARRTRSPRAPRTPASLRRSPS
jgi:hypothetical protein